MTHHKAILDTNKNGFYSWQQNKQLLVQKRGSSRNILCAFLPPRLLSLSISLWTWLTVSWGSGEHEGDLPSPHRCCQTILRTITKMTYRATARLWQGTVLPTYQHRCTSVFYKSTFIFFPFERCPGPFCSLRVFPLRLPLWRTGGRLVFEGIFSSVLLHSSELYSI